MILLGKQTGGFSYRISKTTFCNLIFVPMSVIDKISSKFLSWKSNTALSTAVAIIPTTNIHITKKYATLLSNWLKTLLKVDVFTINVLPLLSLEFLKELML